MRKKKQPDLRFKGFRGDWEEKLLDECGETYTGLSGKSKVDFGHGEGKYVTYMNVFSNIIADPSMVDNIEIDEKQTQVKYGDVFFTTSSETPEDVGMSCVWNEHIANIYLNSFCFGYRPTEKFNNNYLAYMLRSKPMRDKITFLAQGISRYNISKTKVMDIAIPLPIYNEQTKIGEFFKNLDNLIALNQSKYDKLVNVKKAFLGKMFPKEGEDIPDLRFNGFSGKWEEKKLFEIADIIGGGTPSTSIPEYWDGKIDWYSPSEIGEYVYADYSKRKISNLGFEKSSAKMLPANKTVLFTSRASIGDMAILRQPATTNQGFHSFVLRDNYDSYFLYSSGYLIKKYALKNAAGSTFLEISGNQLGKMDFQIPTETEQTKIGEFFQTLDNLITLRKTELDKLKNIKKALLEKMFI